MKIKSQQLNIDPLLLPVEREVNKCSQDVINDKHVCRCLKSKRDILLIYSFLRLFLSAIVVFLFQYKKGIRVKSIAVLSVDFPGFKKIVSDEKQAWA
jgi:hypothetical protein